jgi:hypothetical protein
MLLCFVPFCAVLLNTVNHGPWQCVCVCGIVCYVSLISYVSAVLVVVCVYNAALCHLLCMCVCVYVWDGLYPSPTMPLSV